MSKLRLSTQPPLLGWAALVWWKTEVVVLRLEERGKMNLDRRSFSFFNELLTGSRCALLKKRLFRGNGAISHLFKSCIRCIHMCMWDSMRSCRSKVFYSLLSYSHTCCLICGDILSSLTNEAFRVCSSQSMTTIVICRSYYSQLQPFKAEIKHKWHRIKSICCWLLYPPSLSVYCGCKYSSKKIMLIRPARVGPVPCMDTILFIWMTIVCLPAAFPSTL